MDWDEPDGKMGDLMTSGNRARFAQRRNFLPIESRQKSCCWNVRSLYIFLRCFFCAMPWTLAGDHLALHMFLLATAYNADSASPQPPLNARARHNTENQPKTTNILNSRMKNTKWAETRPRIGIISRAVCFFILCNVSRIARAAKKRREERDDDDEMRYGEGEGETHTEFEFESENRENTFSISVFFPSFSSLLFNFNFSLLLIVKRWRSAHVSSSRLIFLGFISVQRRVKSCKIKQGIPRKSFAPRQERNSAKIIFLAWAQLRARSRVCGAVWSALGLLR